MMKFKKFISEDVLPTAYVADGSFDLEREDVRDALNANLTSISARGFVTPYIGLVKIQKALAQFHIILPKRAFLDGRKGVEVYDIQQYGDRMGMNDQGEFVHSVPTKFYLFFQYMLVGCHYMVIAKIVDKGELDGLMDKAEVALAEDAECRQNTAKMDAPKEEMHDITSDPKKKGNKAAVSDAQKGIKEGWVALGPKGGSVYDKFGDVTPGTKFYGRKAPVNKPGDAEPGAGDTYKNSKQGGEKNRTARSLKKEETLSELSHETLKSYKKSAESDKRSAESSAETSHAHRKNRALPLAKRNAFHDEEKWLKGIAKKREKGIAMADKRLDEITVKQLTKQHHDAKKKEYFDAAVEYEKKHQEEHKKKTEREAKTVKEKTINEISHKLALKAMKKSEKRSDDEYEADQAYDRLSDYKTHEDRAKRLRGHMRKKFGKDKPGRGDKEGDNLSDRRMSDRLKQGKRAGLPSREHITNLKTDIKVNRMLGKHKKVNLPEEEQIDENLGKGMKKYKFWHGNPRGMKDRLKKAGPEFTNKVANDDSKHGGAAELQRRIAKKMTREETQIDEISQKTKLSYLNKSDKEGKKLNKRKDWNRFMGRMRATNPKDARDIDGYQYQDDRRKREQDKKD